MSRRGSRISFHVLCLPLLYMEILMKDAALLKSDVHQKVLLVWFFTKHMVFSTSSVLLATKCLRKKGKTQRYQLDVLGTEGNLSIIKKRAKLHLTQGQHFCLYLHTVKNGMLPSHTKLILLNEN